MTEMIALDQFDFHHRLGETRGPAVVLFTAPGCASCRNWKRLLHEYASHRGGLALYQVDVQRDMALAHEFGVFHLPAVYLYVNGSFHSELQSMASRKAFGEALDRALQGPPQEAP